MVCLLDKFRLLFLSLYYPPDFSAGAFRSGALAKALVGNNHIPVEVTVLAASPHRYPGSFNMSKEKTLKEFGNITLNTVDLPTHNNSMFSQIWAYFFYVRFVMKEMHKGEFDGVYATSSRLLTGFLGAWVSKRLRIPLYLDLRDVFVLNISWLVPGIPSKLVQILFGWFERYSVLRASEVSVTSAGYLPYLESRYPTTNFRVVTNGVDEIFISRAHFFKRKVKETLPEILYAGNIGAAQGVEYIVPLLAKHFKDRFRFRVIGSGSRLGILKTNLSKENIENVIIEGPISRDTLLQRYSAASVLFVTLNDNVSLRKTLPSKLFELAATGKPILARVSGFSSDFIAREIENAAQFNSEDPTSAINALESLRIQQTDRKEFINKYRRDLIVKEHVIDILKALRPDHTLIHKVISTT
jgi:glycosyltransferase involved in cell wall biosynthesis